MSDPNHLNAEVARLLQIISNNPGISPGSVVPPSSPAPPHPSQPAHSLPTASLSTLPQARQSEKASPSSIDALDYTAQFPSYPNQPKIDPSTITQWPAALRYITTVVAGDELVMAKLRKMKKNQLDNEASWHLGRRELVKKHKARIEGTKQVDELLRNLGTPTPAKHLSTDSIGSSDPDISTLEKQELHNFDLKVHKAATQMVTAMSADLARLGIPFFCGGRGGTEKPPGVGEDGNGEYGMDKSDLIELRRRVLDLLGDLVEE